MLIKLLILCFSSNWGTIVSLLHWRNSFIFLLAMIQWTSRLCIFVSLISNSKTLIFLPFLNTKKIKFRNSDFAKIDWSSQPWLFSFAYQPKTKMKKKKVTRIIECKTIILRMRGNFWRSYHITKIKIENRKSNDYAAINYLRSILKILFYAKLVSRKNDQILVACSFHGIISI